MKKLLPILALALILAAPSALSAEDRVVKLPPPNLEGGRPLMAVLNDRRSDRSFGPDELTEQQVADILWAAMGVNRPGDGYRRTAPTARNRQDVDVYALTANGAYLYDAVKHELKPVAAGDQTMFMGAPLGLVFVTPAGERFTEANVGFCSQNVYLYAASEGLNTVVKGTFDQEALSKLLKLPEDKTVVMVQPVGSRP